MRRAALVTLALLGVTSCASGMRPVKQLDTLEVMVGGALNGPGPEVDPEVTAWVRFAPWSPVDITVGGTATIPLFQSFAYGGLLELRGHVPINESLRLTLDVAAEMIRYDPEGSRPLWAHRVTLMPLLVWAGESSLRPYFGPKVMYLSHLDKVSTDMTGSFPGFREGGAGVFMLGGTFGFETSADPFSAVGAAVDVGLMLDAERSDLDGAFVSLAFYFGY